MTPDGAPGAWEETGELGWRLNIPSRFTGLRIVALHATEPVYATSRTRGLAIRLESRLPFVVYLDGDRHQARFYIKNSRSGGRTLTPAQPKRSPK